MGQEATERRQCRRANLNVSAEIRSVGVSGSTSTLTCEVENVSLAGFYCLAKAPVPLKSGEAVMCSVVVPPEQAQVFPFRRLHGKGWIIRTEPVPTGRRTGESPADHPMLGVAVAFAPTVTALGTLES